MRQTPKNMKRMRSSRQEHELNLAYVSVAGRNPGTAGRFTPGVVRRGAAWGARKTWGTMVRTSPVPFWRMSRGDPLTCDVPRRAESAEAMLLPSLVEAAYRKPIPPKEKGTMLPASNDNLIE